MADRGQLSVVATPIGNLGDVTHRALETLSSADLVLAEDTRQTKKLLAHYHITTPLESYHAHSRTPKTEGILRRLAEGRHLALVTDAGTPAVSDPGSALVAAARAAGHLVTPIPGPAAVTAALSASGLGGDAFTFLGFLPHKKGRQTLLGGLSNMIQPVVIYESPHRLLRLLTELRDRHPDAQVVAARELTKLHEEFRLGIPAELVEHYTANPPRGEAVVIVYMA